MLKWLRRLFDHIEWANQRALRVVERTGNERGLELLAHVVASEKVWLTRLQGRASAHLEIWPDHSLEECEALMEENLEGYRRALDSLSSEHLQRRVSYQNSAGTDFRTPIGDILLHVALHGAYHRGQIAQGIRTAGGEPVNTDFITYVREQSDTVRPGGEEAPGPTGSNT